MRRHLPWLLLVVLSLGIALWPLPFTDALPGHPVSDLADHAWGAWWWGGEILGGRWPVHVSTTHLPGGTDLWYVDPLGALLALAARPLGAPAALNLALYSSILAAALVMYAVAWRRWRHGAAAAFAAVATAASPYLLGLVHSGLWEYVGLAFPVLFVGLLLAAVDAGTSDDPGRVRRSALLGALAGMALMACTLQAFYYGAFAVLVGLSFLAGGRIRGRGVPVLVACGVGLVLSAPLLWLGGRTVFGVDAAVGVETAPGWDQVTLPATDVSLFLRPGRHYFPDTPALGNPGILHVHYLGWLLVGLGVAGFLRDPGLRRHRWAVLLYAVAALGPALAWNGRPVEVGGAASRLPLAILYLIPGSPWSFVHHPYRLVAFLVPLLALGAAASVARWRRGAGALLVGALLLETFFVSSAPWPLQRTPFSVPAVYAALPGEGGVLDWPPGGGEANRRYLLWQVGHGRPIPYGLNVFLPDEVVEDPLVATLLRDLDDLPGRARNRDVPRPLRLPPPADPAGTRLAAFGVRWVVVHTADLTPAEMDRVRTLLDRVCGSAVAEVEGRVAWAVPPGGP